jgi:Tfp pilus assembly protein PilF
VQKYEYVNAIWALTKCLGIDPIYLDAYYLRAYSYYEINDFEDTRKDWMTLADLGQVKAAKFLAGFKK